MMLDKERYARIASDPSQITLFKNDFIDGKIGLPTLPSDISKTYTLTYAYDLLQWVAEGESPIRPVPDEPIVDAKAHALILSSDESVESNALTMPNTTCANNAIQL